MRRATVRVPGTIANIGPGFDALGLAVTLANEVALVCDEPRPDGVADDIALDVTVEGEGADEIECDARNLVFRAAVTVFQQVGRMPSRMSLALHNDIPFQRGLGSSAAASVAGAAAANALLGHPLDNGALLNIVAAMEGHPDNAAPAILGGLVVCLKTETGFTPLHFDVPDRYRVVLCVPDVKVSTAAARRVMPTQVSMSDAVFSMSRAAALVGMLVEGRIDAMAEILRDRLHQPYRLPLVAGLAAALAGAVAAGALGAVVSGSGPTLAAFLDVENEDRAEPVAIAMLDALRAEGTQATCRTVALQGKGISVRCE